MTPCCGEEHQLQKIPIIRCRSWDLRSPDDKICQRMPDDYYRYVKIDE